MRLSRPCRHQVTPEVAAAAAAEFGDDQLKAGEAILKLRWGSGRAGISGGSRTARQRDSLRRGFWSSVAAFNMASGRACQPSPWLLAKCGRLPLPRPFTAVQAARAAKRV